ncbi:hypothetical protein BKA62DRAFT_703624 [Auriculariales sp. MPI-PUGE-AT-0066]|nr:hypothetical protein BKA62DRAFT_703624 [Auriculariales sp. MPI-PUGE-AT-0066]
MVSAERLADVYVKTVFGFFGAFLWDLVTTLGTVEWPVIRRYSPANSFFWMLVIARYVMLAGFTGFIILNVPAASSAPEVSCSPVAVFIRTATSIATVSCTGALVWPRVPLGGLFLVHAALLFVPPAYTSAIVAVNALNFGAQCSSLDTTPSGIWNAGTWITVVLILSLCILSLYTAQRSGRLGLPWLRSNDPSWAYLGLATVFHAVPAILGSLNRNGALGVIPAAALYIMLTTRLHASQAQLDEATSNPDGSAIAMSSDVGRSRMRFGFGFGRRSRWGREERSIGSQRTRDTLARYTGGGGLTINAAASVNRLDHITAPKFAIGDDDVLEERKVRHFPSTPDLPAGKAVVFAEKGLDGDAESEIESLGDLSRRAV